MRAGTLCATYSSNSRDRATGSSSPAGQPVCPNIDMKLIQILIPTTPGVRSGNEQTAQQWVDLLE